MKHRRPTARNYNSRPFWRWIRWHRARMKPGEVSLKRWRGSIVALTQRDHGITVEPWDLILQRVTFTDEFLAKLR